MKIRLFASLALVLLLAVSAFAGARVAVVRSVEGKVSADGTPLKRYAPLTEGAKLSLEAGAVVTVDYLKSRRREVIKGPGQVVVGGSGSTGSASIAASGGEHAKSSLPSSENSRQIAGKVVRDEPAVSLATVGVLSENPPVFRWKPTGEVPGPYHLEVRGKDGALWSTRTEATEVAYAGPGLAQDQVYFVEVWSDAEYGMGSAGATAPFSILSPLTVELLDAAALELRAAGRENKDPRPLLLLMEMYLDNAVVDQAVQAGEEALAFQGLSEDEQRELHHMLGRLYKTLGDKEKSVEHLSQAKS